MKTANKRTPFGPRGNSSCWYYVLMGTLVTFRRKIDVSGIEVNGLPQNKTRRGVRRA